MEIRIDPRVGSKHLFEPLRKRLHGNHSVELTPMKYGDIAWTAEGPEGEPVKVGVELKKLPDLLGSITSKRLIETQVPGLVSHYRVAYLLLEGKWHCRPDGGLDIYGGQAGRHGWTRAQWRPTGFRFDAVDGLLCSLESRLGIRVGYTGTREETIAWLCSRVRWWAKKWDEHTSCEPWTGMTILGNPLRMRTPSKAESMALILPGVGQEKLYAVAKKFKSMRGIANTTAEDWVGIAASGATKTGRKRPALSLDAAQKIQEALDEECQ